METVAIERGESKESDQYFDCPKHGQFAPSITRGAEMIRCESCSSEYESACAEAYKRRYARQHSARCLVNSGVPKRHRRKSFKNFDPQNDDQRAALVGAELYAEKFSEHLRAGRCLGFIGPPGVGKSHLGCAVLLSLAERGYSVRYVTATDLIYDIRNTWNRGAEETTATVVDRFCGYQLLLIDDVGCLSAELEHVRHVIERRYNAELPTMITSNMGTQEIASFIDARGLDRLRENGGLLFAMSGTSRRSNTESTMVEEPAWWEKYLSHSSTILKEIEAEEDSLFSVRIQDYPGIYRDLTIEELA